MPSPTISDVQLFLWLAPLLLASLTALSIERSAERRGLLPPGTAPGGAAAWRFRRAAASTTIALALFLVVFQPLVGLWVGVDLPVDPSAVPRWRLFLVHAILAVTLAVWCTAGWAGVPAARSRPLADVAARQLGLRAPRIWDEVGLGIVVGVVAWAAVIAVMLVVSLGIAGLGIRELVPDEVPRLIALVGSLPWWLRLAISVSAGFFEEVFFRGFLQPRVGIALSTVLFVLAHASYGQPLLWVGVGLLSLAFAALARWRQSVWAAASAHATFDAIQLLVVVPTALEVAG